MRDRRRPSSLVALCVAAACVGLSRAPSVGAVNPGIAGVLSASMREMVIDRAMDVGGGPMELEDLKIIVLMVFWSLGEEPDALVLDELFVASEDRLIH